MRWNRPYCCEFDEKLIKTKTIWSEFPNGGEAIEEQILASEEMKRFKRERLWES